MGGFRGVKFLLAATIALFAAAGIYTTIVILERQATLEDSSRYTVSWSVSQAANELARFMHRLVAFAQGSDQVTADEVRLRLDILLNRASILTQGEKSKQFIAGEKARHELVRDLDAALGEIDRAIGDIARPDRARAAFERIAPFEAPIVRLASDAYRFDSLREAEERQELLRLHWLFSSLTAGLIVSGLAFIGLVLWQNRLISRARDRLQTMADDLSRTTVSQRYLDDIINGMSEGLLVLAPRGEIEKVNRAACRLTGHAPRQILGRPVSSLLPPEAAADIEAAPDPLKRLAAITEIMTADARRLPVRMSTAAVEGEGQANARVVCVFQDLTVQRRIEAERSELREQLYQAQKMQAIGTLAGGIAHDFNNILGSILGYGFLAMEEVPADHPSREQLDQIMRAGNRAKDLVHQILTYSRNAGPSLQAVDVGRVVDEAMASMRPTLPPAIVLSRGRWEDASVMAEEGDLHRVLLNLCVNASHAIGERGGEIVVSVEAAATEGNPTTGVSEFKGADVRPDEDPNVSTAGRTRLWFGKLEPGRYCRIAVDDTGCGMDRATMTRIFEPFFTTKEVGKGTGLGLAAVHGIMRNIGGVVAVESEPGKGTRFEIYLPLTSEQREPDVGGTAPAPDAAGSGERVMLVDDDVALLEMARQTLSRLGYDIVAFAEPEAALQAFGAAPHSFDAVLTDRNMPGLDGERLCAALLELRADLPIVMVTGYGNADDERRILALGVRKMLFKPVVGADLAAALRRVLATPVVDARRVA